MHRAGECGRVLSEVGCEGIPGRALARRLAVAIMAVLLGSPVVRVHRFKPPKSVVCCLRPLPAFAHRAVASGPGPLEGVCLGSGQPNPKPSHSIYDSSGYRAVRDVTVS
ncbi:hypothetical protein STVIR_2510 [Streptomyces viridochromogenes Tue57]|uniref:Uncharacterized protein n=1 Tax=Streptomyces viridochromogenes Tue57 TaxID=1160705 RepID=L8PJV3_STRVR|nr:hypothetical protein STVIR_2510 [Streptomyces viridochromogenes Tue57]